MLVFSEDNFFYQIFSICISFICLFSSYYYIYLTAFRNLNLKASMIVWTYIFEIMFFVHMILQFFKEIKSDYSAKAIRNVKIIAKNYLKKEFIWDFIPLVPL